MTAEFDNYVDDYARQHQASIRLSGETPDYFADYKIRELRRLTRLWGMETPRILDFGSGLGNSVPAFRTRFPGAVVTQSDVSQASLDGARTLHGGSEPQILISGGRLPAEDGAFDLAFVACVFHHIPEDEHVDWLSELRRVVRPGGRIVVFEHNPLNPATRHAVRNCPFDQNAVLIRAGTLSARLARAGWIRPTTDFHVFIPGMLRALRPLEAWLRWCPMGAQYACSGIAP